MSLTIDGHGYDDRPMLAVIGAIDRLQAKGHIAPGGPYKLSDEGRPFVRAVVESGYVPLPRDLRSCLDALCKYEGYPVILAIGVGMEAGIDRADIEAEFADELLTGDLWTNVDPKEYPDDDGQDEPRDGDAQS